MRPAFPLILMVTLGLSTRAFAQTKPAEEPLSAERPGFTNGTETVPMGHILAEVGYLYSKTGGTTVNRLLDSAQIRYPLSERSEVRFGLPAYTWGHGDGGVPSGLDDTSVSGKWRFLDGNDRHPSLALIAGSLLPTGKSGIGQHYFRPYLDFEVSQDIGQRFTAQVNAVYNDARENGQRFDQWAGAFNLGVHLTEVLDGFAEVYRVSPTGYQAPRANYFDGGFTYVISNRIQLDLSTGVGITREVRHDYFLGTGIARRW